MTSLREAYSTPLGRILAIVLVGVFALGLAHIVSAHHGPGEHCDLCHTAHGFLLATFLSVLLLRLAQGESLPRVAILHVPSGSTPPGRAPPAR